MTLTRRQARKKMGTRTSRRANTKHVVQVKGKKATLKPRPRSKIEQMLRASQ